MKKLFLFLIITALLSSCRAYYETRTNYAEGQSTRKSMREIKLHNWKPIK